MTFGLAVRALLAMSLALTQGAPPIPPPRGLVNDFAGVLTPEAASRSSRSVGRSASCRSSRSPWIGGRRLRWSARRRASRASAAAVESIRSRFSSSCSSCSHCWEDGGAAAFRSSFRSADSAAAVAGGAAVDSEAAVDSAASVVAEDSAAVAAALTGDHMATMTLDELVKQLHAAYGQNLVSVVLYGSAAAGEHVAKKSDYNVLVLLNRVDATHLAAASSVARAWRESGNPPPMTMTVDEGRHSADAFPMEYADILERHRVLHGAPPFEGISVSNDDLRLQLESQVMGKLLQLRQGALLAGTDTKRQIELIEASFSTIMVLFRAVLRLNGEKPPVDNAALSDAAGPLVGFDAAPFVRMARHHRGDARIPDGDASVIFSHYLAGVERLDAYLDTFTREERSP